MKDEGSDQNLTSPIQRSRALRRNSTDAERRLWQILRNHQLEGMKFRRQHPIGPYILDFYCLEQGLAVEVDGGQYLSGDQVARDEARTNYLAGRGVRVLRFTNLEVLREPNAVAETIRQELRTPSP